MLIKRMSRYEVRPVVQKITIHNRETYHFTAQNRAVAVPRGSTGGDCSSATSPRDLLPQ